jgi:hypothetical protein
LTDLAIACLGLFADIPRYSRWERDGALSFIPPDGRFKLLDYAAGPVSQLPVSLKAKLSVDDNGGESQYPSLLLIPQTLTS